MLLNDYLLVVFSAFLHSFWNFFAKKSPQKLEIAVLGLGLASLVFLPGLWVEEKTFTVYGGLITLATGFLQAWYLFFLYRAYSEGNLTLVYPVSRGVGVIGTFFLEIFWTPHAYQIKELAGILLISIGTSLLSLHEIRGTQRKGVLFSLVVGIILSFAFLLGKISTAYISPFSYLWGMYASSFLFALLFLRQRPLIKLKTAFFDYRTGAWIIGLGSFVSYLIVVFVYKHAPAAKVVSLRELSVVFGCILGFVFLKEKISFLKGLSILLITAGAIALKFH